MIKKDEFDTYWDNMIHTANEYQAEIRSMRERIASYVKEIEDLKVEKHALTADWIRALDEIRELRERIATLTEKPQ